MPNPSIPEEVKKRIEKDAQAKYPFVWPKNKDGEDITMRVGQANPPGSRKAKNIQSAYIAGATAEAARAEDLRKENEMLRTALKSIFYSPIPANDLDAWRILDDITNITAKALQQKGGENE